MDSTLDLADASIVPPELTGPLPRRTRTSGNGIQMVIAAAVLLGIGVAYVIWGGIDATRQMEHRTQLRHSGSEAVGVINRLWSPGRSPKTRVSYTFIADGTPFVGEAQVPNRLVHGLLGSNTLPIRYLSANPAINHPAAWEWSVVQNSDFFIAAILCMAFGLLLFIPLRMERRLVAEGVPAAGLITGCSRGRRSGFSVKYDFRTQDGSIAKGNGWFDRNQQVGAKICVLYLPQNPRRSQPYPSPNYRVTQ